RRAAGLVGVAPLGPGAARAGHVAEEGRIEAGRALRREGAHADDERLDGPRRALRKLVLGQGDAGVGGVVAETEERRAGVGGDAIGDEDEDLLAAGLERGLRLKRLELAVAAGHRVVRGRA